MNKMQAHARAHARGGRQYLGTFLSTATLVGPFPVVLALHATLETWTK